MTEKAIYKNIIKILSNYGDYITYEKYSSVNEKEVHRFEVLSGMTRTECLIDDVKKIGLDSKKCLFYFDEEKRPFVTKDSKIKTHNSTKKVLEAIKLIDKSITELDLSMGRFNQRKYTYKEEDLIAIKNNKYYDEANAVFIDALPQYRRYPDLLAKGLICSKYQANIDIAFCSNVNITEIKSGLVSIIILANNEGIEELHNYLYKLWYAWSDLGRVKA